MKVPYAREVGAVVVLVALAGWTWLVYDYAGKQGQLDVATARLEVADEYRATVEYWQKQAHEADEALEIALKKQPPTGKRVANAVRNNPAPTVCVVPDAVVDELQDGINAGKDSTL